MNDRRTFLKLIAAAAGTGHAGSVFAGQSTPAAAAPRGQAAAPPLTAAARPTAGTIRKSVLISMLPKGRPYAERFALAREAGFEAIEMQTIGREEEAAEIREASQKTGLRVHSVMNDEHWRSPLSSSDPDVVTRSVRGMETSISVATQ